MDVGWALRRAAVVDAAGSAPEPWHARPVEEVMAGLATDRARGLSGEAVRARLGRHGPNALGVASHEPWWEEALEALREPLQLLLLAIGLVYFLIGEIEDAVTIAAVIVAVVAIEVVNELRARTAVAALSALGAPVAVVIRDGSAARVPATGLVPGDVILVAPGDRVPADGRLIESSALRVDESSLTGESVSTSKEASAVLAEDAELGDRRTMVYAGTLVTAGRGVAVVVATGRRTVLGGAAGLIEEGRETPTPLEAAMRELAGWLVWVALAVSVGVPLLGIVLAGLPVRTMVLTGLTLAFATIPEELPILVTIVLAIGSYQLARRGAIVKRLRAAETLGSVSVVATDKTGTLTENGMRVVEVFADDRTSPPAIVTPTGRRLMEIGILANDAQVARADGRIQFTGDPTETALLVAAEDAGLRVDSLRAAVDFLEEYPFDDDRRRMSVIVVRDGRRLLALKGAPESVIADSVAIRRDGREELLDDAGRARLRAQADEMAGRGLRVLALAERRLPDEAKLAGRGAREVEADLTVVGLVGLEDPPRQAAAEAVQSLRAAGIRVLMLTGDHPATAAAIADRVGIGAGQVIRGRDLDTLSEAELAEAAMTTAVFARITPEHKLRVVQALQSRGEVVAVTGDGVNDGPALRAAAVGIAMGQKGTDVAREAADIVLADDNLATIAAAVRAGRTIYANLRKAVRFYLAVKVALVSASIAAILLHLPVPFEPVQIILMELFMDVGASMTFVTEPPEGDVMKRSPRDAQRPFLDRSMRLGILAGGLSLGAAVIVAYVWAWAQGLGQVPAQTAAFAAWMVGHVVLAAHMRSERGSVVRTFLSNRAYLVWAAAAIFVVVLGSAAPFLQERLHLAALPASAWLVTVAVAVIVPSWWEPWKWWRARAGTGT